MKKIVFSILFILATCSFVSAQSFRAEFNKARSIKLLESNRKDVKRILTGLKSDEEAKKEKEAKPIYSETFSSKYSDIDVSYLVGDCSDESDDVEQWNVPKGKVTYATISPNETVKLKDFDYDISSFLKEQQYANIESSFIYSNKGLGIAIVVDDDEIESIRFFPSSSYYSFLCNNEEAELAKEIYSTKSYFGKSKLKDRKLDFGHPPGIIALELSKSEIVGCGNSKDCSVDNEKILVTTSATDPEDNLTYNYTVSGGEVIGKGKQVIWDLSRAPAGTYTITATIDDGCGVCAEPKTEVVVVK